MKSDFLFSDILLTLGFEHSTTRYIKFTSSTYIAVWLERHHDIMVVLLFGFGVKSGSEVGE